MSQNTPRVRNRERVRPLSAAGAAAPASNDPSPEQFEAAGTSRSRASPRDGLRQNDETGSGTDSAATSAAAPAPAAVPLATSVRAASYEVGYCKPPKATQFQPGRSGNMKGRPKKHSTISGAFEAALQAKHSITINGRAMRLTQAEIIVMQTLKKAMGGDARAMALVFKYEMARKQMASGVALRSPNPDLQRSADDGSASLDVEVSATDRAVLEWLLLTIDAGNDDVAVGAIGVREDDQFVGDHKAEKNAGNEGRAARGDLKRRRGA